MDETYIKIKGIWQYLYRDVNKEGNTIDFMLAKNRDEVAAKTFFIKAIGSSGLPEKSRLIKVMLIKLELTQLTLNCLFFHYWDVH